MSLRPYVPLTPLLRGSQQTMPLTHLLDQLSQPSAQEGAARSSGNPDIPVTPVPETSLGDLCMPQQRPGVDFEYYSPAHGRL